jgi:AraC-like DNA-binding protein
VTAACGTSLTRIRTRLRVRHALERMAGDGGDLASIAVDAGFYDQAHMTNVIRREVGETPRSLR